MIFVFQKVPPKFQLYFRSPYPRIRTGREEEEEEKSERCSEVGLNVGGRRRGGMGGENGNGRGQRLELTDVSLQAKLFLAKAWRVGRGVGATMANYATRTRFHPTDQ